MNFMLFIIKIKPMIKLKKFELHDYVRNPGHISVGSEIPAREMALGVKLGHART